METERRIEEESMKEQVWKYMAGLSTSGFFITADIVREGKEFPTGIKAFIGEKLAQIRDGIPARKFSFHAEGWHIHFTFFPTDRVVDERYALKNRAMKRRSGFIE